VEDLLDLKPASRTEMPVILLTNGPAAGKDQENQLEGPPQQPWPVLDGHDGVPGVDKVKVVSWVKPRTLNIIQHKSHIWWHPLGLNRAEVYTQYCRAIKKIPHYQNQQLL